mmetsp:Transcript_14539/g.25085  ORF Transcript_14539/g.25085 Transcript_14539/m.25085 type:complete len:327 (+) Transcript_14539:379-1359(+)
MDNIPSGLTEPGENLQTAVAARGKIDDLSGIVPGTIGASGEGISGAGGISAETLNRQQQGNEEQSTEGGGFTQEGAKREAMETQNQPNGQYAHAAAGVTGVSGPTGSNIEGHGVQSGGGEGVAPMGPPGMTIEEEQGRGMGTAAGERGGQGISAPTVGGGGQQGMPSGYSKGRNILILVDDSDNAMSAVAWFSGSSLLPSDKVEVLHIQPNMGSSDSDVAEQQEQIHKFPFSKFVSFLSEPGVLPQGHITTNMFQSSRKSDTSIAKAARDYINSKDFDLVVLGRHGTGTMQRMKAAFSMGDVCDQVVSHIDVPVVIVHQRSPGIHN